MSRVTQDEQRQRELKEQRDKEQHDRVKQEQDDAKKYAELEKRVSGFSISSTAAGYVLFLKPDALDRDSIAVIYDFWRRNFGPQTPLMIVLSDDPKTAKAELRTVTPAAGKKGASEFNVLLFRNGDVSPSDAVFYRDYSRRRHSRPVLTIGLDDPAVEISIAEVVK